MGEDTPAYAYFDSLWPTPLNWAFWTVPQPNAANREIFWPRGKVLGGSYLRLGYEKEIDAQKMKAVPPSMGFI